MAIKTKPSTPDTKALDLGLKLHELLTCEERAIALYDLDRFAELTARRKECMEQWRASLGSLGETARRVAQALGLRLQAMAADNDDRARRILALQAEVLFTVLDSHAERMDAAAPWATYAIERDDARPMAA